MRFVFSCRPLLALLGFAAMSTVLAQPAAAGMEEAVKAMQANDLATAEKELAVLIKERDPRAQFLAGFYIYGNPESKLYDVNKATPLLLDAAERGYVPARAYRRAPSMPTSGSSSPNTGMHRWRRSRLNRSSAN